MKLTTAVLVVAFKQLTFSASLFAQQSQPSSAAQAVNQMPQAERTAWNSLQQFLHRSEEHSNRTNGHLWDELVVETPDGSIHGLISEDGKTLTGTQKIAEDMAFIASLALSFLQPAETKKAKKDRIQLTPP